MIHVYCSASKQDSTSAVLRCETALGCTIDNPQVHTVRDVSPSQNMYCVSFRLPEAVRRDTKKAKNVLDVCRAKTEKTSPSSLLVVTARRLHDTARTDQRPIASGMAVLFERHSGRTATVCPT